MSAAAVARPHWNWLGVAWTSTPWTSPVFCDAVRARARRAGLESVSTVPTCATSDCRVRWTWCSRVRVPEQPRGPPRPAPCAGRCGSRAGRRRMVLFRRQHRAIVSRRLPADVLGRRLEIQARATWKSGGRRATRSARLRVARPGRTSLAARARDVWHVCWTDAEIRQGLRKAGFDFVRRFDGFDVRPKMRHVSRGTDAYYLARKAKAGHK